MNRLPKKTSTDMQSMDSLLVDVDQVDICGVRISSVSMHQLHTLVSEALGRISLEKPLVIFTPNPEQVVLANQGHKSDSQMFGRVLDTADLRLPDGVGLLWADRWLSWRHGTARGLRERVTGVDAMQMIVKEALKRGKNVFLLGGRGDVAKRATEGLKERLGLTTQQLRANLAWSSGSGDIANETLGERVATQQAIAEHKPAVVFVAFGAPWQERWVQENLEALQQQGVRVVMVVGGALDMLAGKVNRAPEWMQRAGLEWLWRLAKEPWRWRRQLALLKFVGMVVRK